MIVAHPEWKEDCSKRGLLRNELLGAVHLNVVSRYVKKFREIGMRLDGAEAVRNRLKKNCFDLRVIPLIAEQRLLMRGIAYGCNEVETKAENVYEDWDLDGMVFVDGIAASVV